MAGRLYRRTGRPRSPRAQARSALDAGPMAGVNLTLAGSPRGEEARALEARLRAARGVRRFEPYLEALHDGTNL